MNHYQAINVIRNLAYRDGIPNEEIKEAIEELKQKPCEDTISRKEVLKMIDDMPESKDINSAITWLNVRIINMSSVTPIKTMTKDKALRILKNNQAQMLYLHKRDDFICNPDELEALNMAISVLEQAIIVS